MKNALYVIEIYRHAGTWCFTDTERDLVHEPFVLGIPEFIDQNIKTHNLGSLDSNYRVIFSEDSFPAYQGLLAFQEREHGGAWYQMLVPKNKVKTDEKEQGWLCPATLKFFADFPESIYFKLELVKP